MREVEQTGVLVGCAAPLPQDLCLPSAGSSPGRHSFGSSLLPRGLGWAPSAALIPNGLAALRKETSAYKSFLHLLWGQTTFEGEIVIHTPENKNRDCLDFSLKSSSVKGIVSPSIAPIPFLTADKIKIFAICTPSLQRGAKQVFCVVFVRVNPRRPGYTFHLVPMYWFKIFWQQSWSQGEMAVHLAYPMGSGWPDELGGSSTLCW